jgi:hypothetical protein
MQAAGARFELHVLALLCVLVVAAGCKPEIGDDCQVSTDCSNVGDRLCDTTQPGGYCTIFNCEPGTCPEEAICVGFKTSISASCPDPQDGIRLQRTFCMRNCSDNSDCRSGYQCIDLGNPQNPWGAKVMESGSYNGAVCIVPHKGITQGGGATGFEQPPGICTGTDAGFDVQFWEPDSGGTTLPDAGADTGADTGSDAGTDASDDAGDAGSDASSDASVD